MRRTPSRYPLRAAVLLAAGGLLVGSPGNGRPAGSGPSVVAPAPASASRPFEHFARRRGVCWEGNGPIGIDHLRPVRELGADWISQTPFGWSRALDAPEIHLATERVWWGESDSGLVQTTRMARSLGLATLLKPHLWIRHGQWTGDLRMRSEADWKTWFASYESWILHYARLAEAQKIEALAVGTELGGTSHRTGDWRRLIGRVREVYHGQLTYCANWHGEAERIEFWDALDYIGVQAYYPLATTERADADTLRAAWRSIRAQLATLAVRTSKPIVFTEVGYKSVTGALREPWRWETHGEPDMDLQRDAFATLFEALWPEAWFGGTFVWKWHPDVNHRVGRIECDFTPQGKPALAVIRSWYRADGP